MTATCSIPFWVCDPSKLMFPLIDCAMRICSTNILMTYRSCSRWAPFPKWNGGTVQLVTKAVCTCARVNTYFMNPETLGSSKRSSESQDGDGSDEVDTRKSELNGILVEGT